MKRTQVLLVALVVLLAVSATTTLTLAQGPIVTGPALAPLASAGTAFTYQGHLKSGGNVVNGACAMAFRLYDDPSGSGLIGGPITTTVPVTNGLFTVGLDYGSNAFDGNGRWLDIQVACPPGGSYVPLTPRQPLTPAPYALFASNASLLDGQGSSAFVAITGTQTIGGAKTFSDGVKFSDGTTQLTAATKAKNVLVVAKSGGDFTSITAALDSITGNSPTNHYLVYVSPGTYTETVIMKPFVDIEGAGELATKITNTGSDLSNIATVKGASNAELRFLTVENTGGLAYAIAIYNFMRAPRLTHLTASAFGGTYNYGVYGYGSSPTMADVTANAFGGTYNYGVYNYASSSPTMTTVIASAFGGTDSNYGVYNSSSSPAMANVSASASGGTENYGVYNNSSSPSMKNVTASAAGGNTNSGVYNHSSSPAMTGVTAIGSGGTYANNGVVNDASSSPVMMDVTAKATGGGVVSYAVYNVGSFPTMTNVTAIAEAGGLNMSNGVYNRQSSATINNSFISGVDIGIQNFAASGIYTVTVNNSQISGSTNTIINVTGFTTRVGGSYLNGGPAAASGGTLTCAGVYDEAYAFHASTCP